MHITFDPYKSEKNEKERGLPFGMAVDFDLNTALLIEDTRQDYPETRLVAYGLIGTRVHVLCFTPTSEGIRVISLRKANKREVKKYVEETSIFD